MIFTYMFMFYAILNMNITLSTLHLAEPSEFKTFILLLKISSAENIFCNIAIIGVQKSHSYFENCKIIFPKQAISNGHALSALVGSKRCRDHGAEKVFATGSFWFSSAAQAAALATIVQLEKR